MTELTEAEKIIALIASQDPESIELGFVLQETFAFPQVDAYIKTALFVAGLPQTPPFDFRALAKINNPYDYTYVSSSESIDLPAEAANIRRWRSWSLWSVKRIKIADEVLPFLRKKLNYISIYQMHADMIQILLSALQGSQIEEIAFKFCKISPACLELLSRIDSLTKIEIEHCKISYIPFGIWQLPKLDRLEASNCNMITLCDQALPLNTALRELVLDNNEIKSLTPSISQLKALEELNLAHNQLKALPKTLGQLANLQTLYLASNQIEALPDAIEQLSNLSCLSIGDNKIRYLPKNIGNLRELGNFYAQNNQLESLPNSFSRLTKLWYINLSENYFYRFPPQLSNFTSLRDLNLSDNALSDLPHWINKMKHLYVLNLRNNQIKSLPKTLLHLTVGDPERTAHEEDNSAFIIGNNPIEEVPTCLLDWLKIRDYGYNKALKKWLEADEN
jgi:Leucine-rich repeat (LRR) protein